MDPWPTNMGVSSCSVFVFWDHLCHHVFMLPSVSPPEYDEGENFTSVYRIPLYARLRSSHCAHIKLLHRLVVGHFPSSSDMAIAIIHTYWRGRWRLDVSCVFGNCRLSARCLSVRDALCSQKHDCLHANQSCPCQDLPHFLPSVLLPYSLTWPLARCSLRL